MLAAAFAIAGCAADPTVPVERSTSVSPESASSSPAPSPRTSVQSEETSAPPAVEGDSSKVLRLCSPGPPEPSDIDCKDAVDVAMGAGVATPPIRAELIWSPFCAVGTPCPSQAQDPDIAYVVLYLGDGSGLQVPVRLVSGGVVGGSPSAIPAQDIGPRPTVSSPPEGKADVGPAPPTVSNRASLPLCGAENAGLAGPFDAAVRNCFMSSLIAGRPAEFASRRSDVGGVPFLELWRFEGSGPVTVFRNGVGGWTRLVCGIVRADGNQLFDHTDCSIAPIS